MKINLILSTLLLPFFVFSQEITSISPNQAHQGDYLDVTISGSNINFQDYSQSSSIQFTYSDYSQGYSFSGNIYSSDNTYAYADVNVPAEAYTGNYDVQVFDYNSNNWITLENGFYVEQAQELVSINYISPNQAHQGESLNVNISGTNMDFSQYYDDYSGMGWYEYSSFQLVYGDYSDTYTISGNINEDYGDEASASVYVPNNAPTGEYDVKVYDYNSNSYVYLNNGFTVSDDESFGQYYDINGTLIDFDNISQNQEILFYFSCFSEVFDIPEYSDYLLPIYNNFGCNQEDVFVVIIGAFECGNMLEFASNYNVQIPIINLIDQWSDPLMTHFNIEGAPDIFLNNNETNLERDYESIETVLIDNDANIDPCPMITSISPNISALDQNLEVTISGTNVGFSQYYDDYSGVGWYEYSSIQLVYGDYSDTYTINGNINEDYGNSAQASVYIPNNAPNGEYDVKVFDYNTYNWIVLENGFYVEQAQESASINWISPNQAEQGQSLNVTISGSNINFQDYSQSSSIQFTYSDYSQGYSFSGNIYSSDNTYAYANVNVPSEAYTGNYDVQVFDYNSYNWITLENGFQISETCDNLISNSDLISNSWVMNFSPCYDSIPNTLYLVDFNLDSNAYLTDVVDGSEYLLSWSLYGCNLNMDFQGSPYNSSYSISDESFNSVSDYNFQNPENCFKIYPATTEEILAINWISPNEAHQGDYLDVTISGSNINFQDYSQSSPVYFVYNDYSQGYSFSGNIYSSDNTYAYASVNVPSEAYQGNYDIQVFDYNSNNWITLVNGFHVVEEGINSNNFCANSSGLYCEDFEGVIAPSLPNNMSTESTESNYFIPEPGAEAVETGAGIQVNGFYVGNGEDANVGAYFPVGTHTQFAMTNDDACMPGNIAPNGNNNCDLSVQTLILPNLNFVNQSSLWLQFEYYHDQNYGGGDAYVQITTDNGNNWQDISGPLSPAQVWQYGAVDLSLYEGNSQVKIRFTWSDNGTWASGFAIDNIIISPLEDYSLTLLNQTVQLSSPYLGMTSYKTMPINQAQSGGYYFKADLKNNGANDFNEVQINVSIENEGFSSSSDGINLLSLSQEEFYANDYFTPSDTGIYNVEFYGSTNEGLLTQTEFSQFKVSEFEYARDDADFSGGPISGALINDQGTEQRGNVFDIYQQTTLHSVKAWIHEKTSLNTTAKAVLNIVDIATGDVSFLDETPQIYVGQDRNGWVDFIFNDPIELNEGEVLLATIYSEFNGVDTLVLGQSGISQPNESLLQDTDGTQTGGNPGDWYYTTSTPMVRLNLNSENISQSSIESIYPNEAMQGDYLNVTISGTNINFEGSYLQFTQYDDYSNVTQFYGYINEYEEESGYANIEIPNYAPLGYYHVQVYDYNTGNEITLENGFYVNPQVQSSIESIYPNEAMQGDYLDVTVSGTNINFDNSYLQFIQYDDYSNSTQFNGYFNGYIEESGYVNIYVPNSAPQGYYDVQVYDYNTGNEITLENGFYVSQASPCDNWEIYGNDIFDVPFLSDDEDIAFVCNGSVLEVQGAWHNSFSIENLYWSNGQPISSSLVIENDTNASIVFISEDTTCIVETIQINVIQNIEEIAEITTVLNSCYGVQDGSIEIEGLFQDEGQSLVFSAQQELIPFLSQFDYEDNLLQESLQITNPNEVSQVFVAWEYGSDGCIFDVDFNTEIETPESYNLPFTELFDSGMPCDWLNSNKWTFGQTNELSGLYWDIPEHNMFAVSNDDLCNCDMMEDKLISPPINLGNETGNLILAFATYFNGYYGSQAQIDISSNNGESWVTIANLSASNQWQGLEFDISQFLGNDQIQISFTHSDGHSWGSGFAIDDVAVFFQCADDDNDGVCNDNEILGCTNIEANNYNELASEDDGSCQIDIYGCTYLIAINYNPNANIDDGTCYFTLNGCNDELAINYNPDATSDDGSCEYIISENPCDIVPTGMFVDNIIHNRVVFNWSAPIAAPSHYMIRYRAVGTTSWTVMSAGPVNSNEFTGTSRTRYFMDAATTYQWSIRARVLNEDGSTNCQSSWSSNSEYTTLPECANLENLSVSAEANWATLMADAPAAEWGVWQSKGKMRELGTNSYRYVNGDSEGAINFLKGNFDASTDYEWHTKAWCTGNVDANGDADPMYHSAWGEFSAFSTEDLCDAVPLNLSTSSNGANTSITMTWDTPESGAPDHYFLELTNETSGQVWAWNAIAGNSNSKTKYGLTTGNNFSWRIRGACGTNGTSWATSFTSPVYYTLGAERLAGPVANLDVYPNPSRDIFNVTFTSEEAQTMTVKVVNMIGEEIFTEELTEFVGKYTQVIDMNAQPKGVYFLEITTSTGGINKKIVLQ